MLTHNFVFEILKHIRHLRPKFYRFRGRKKSVPYFLEVGLELSERGLAGVLAALDVPLDDVERQLELSPALQVGLLGVGFEQLRLEVDEVLFDLLGDVFRVLKAVEKYDWRMTWRHFDLSTRPS